MNEKVKKLIFSLYLKMIKLLSDKVLINNFFAFVEQAKKEFKSNQKVD